MSPKIPTAWSFSSFDMWRQCPLKYKLTKIDKLDKEQSPAMIRGNYIHVALAKYISGDNVTLPTDVVSDYHKMLYRAMREFTGMKVVEQQTGFSSSWKVTAYFGADVWLRAVLDVGLIYDDAEVEVIDHKTGKRYGSNDEQVELFALTSMWRWPQAQQVVTRLIYVDSGDEELAFFPAKDRDKLTDKWTAAAKVMLDDRTWPARPNDKCRWCPFGQSKGGQCRHG